MRIEGFYKIIENDPFITVIAHKIVCDEIKKRNKININTKKIEREIEKITGRKETVGNKIIAEACRRKIIDAAEKAVEVNQEISDLINTMKDK